MKSYYIILTISTYQDNDGTWAANCDELGTSTFGDFFEEVTQDVKKLVILHLNTLEETGERERFFKENDIEIYERIPQDIEVPVKPGVYYNQYIREVQFA